MVRRPPAPRMSSTGIAPQCTPEPRRHTPAGARAPHPRHRPAAHAAVEARRAPQVVGDAAKQAAAVAGHDVHLQAQLGQPLPQPRLLPGAGSRLRPSRAAPLLPRSLGCALLHVPSRALACFPTTPVRGGRAGHVVVPAPPPIIGRYMHACRLAAQPTPAPGRKASLRPERLHHDATALHSTAGGAAWCGRAQQHMSVTQPAAPSTPSCSLLSHKRGQRP
jgi:hypothetical protein